MEYLAQIVPVMAEGNRLFVLCCISLIYTWRYDFGYDSYV